MFSEQTKTNVDQSESKKVASGQTYERALLKHVEGSSTDIEPKVVGEPPLDAQHPESREGCDEHHTGPVEGYSHSNEPESFDR